MTVAKEKFEELALEHDEKLQECEQRIADADAAHELHIEQLQAQVMHYHDLAMKAVDGNAAGTVRPERPMQSSPAPAAATNAIKEAGSEFTAKICYKSSRVSRAVSDAAGMAVPPQPVTEVAASSVHPAGGGGAQDASVPPPPPAPHAVPRRAARPTSSAFDADGDFEEITDGSETVTRRIKEHKKIVVPEFPAVTNVRQWHNGVARGLVLASGRTDH